MIHKFNGNQNNGKQRKTIKINCSYCKKEFETLWCLIKNNKNHFCSKNCMIEWQKENLIGRNNPFYGKQHQGESLEKIKKGWFKKGHKAWNSGTQKFVELDCYVCKQKFKRAKKEEKRNRNQKRHYCSRACWSKQGIQISCLYCNKKLIRRESELKYKGIKRQKIKSINSRKSFCSSACRAKWISENGAISGENNPMFGLKGALSPSWRGGLSFEPYTLDFNDQFKELIRKRDNHCCLICNKSQKELWYKLSVHHVDYNKKNSFSQNCVSLCSDCHRKTNTNREEWKMFFRKLLQRLYSYEYTEEQKVVYDFINNQVTIEGT